MWIFNEDLDNWSEHIESLKKVDFDSFKQDLKFLRFYQRVLSGATYTHLKDLNDIYGILNIYKAKTFHYTKSFSKYTTPYKKLVEDSEQIKNETDSDNFHDKFLGDYGFTLKNLFTPKRLIEDQIKNIVYVDATTIDVIEDETLFAINQSIDLNVSQGNLVIDDVVLKEGSKILIRDQYDIITLQTSVDPEKYFEGYYVKLEEIGSSSTYYVPNSKNGIYTFKNKRFVKTSDFENYETTKNFIIYVREGTDYANTTWTLQRLKSGYFPLGSQPRHFTLASNFVLRNRVDYNNLFELVLNDTLKHDQQIITIDDKTWTIPQRTISIGEFGVIFVHQEGYTTIINNKFKYFLRSISQNNFYYWICGDDGIVLKVDKRNFNIERVILFDLPKPVLQPGQANLGPAPNINLKKVITQLNSISFYNSLLGGVVGKFNQIWITEDGGNFWSRINIIDFESYNYNTIIFTGPNKFYVGGDNGVFIEFTYENSNWTAFKRRVSKKIDNSEDNEFILNEDIKDINYFTYSFGSTTGDFIGIAALRDNLYVYDVDKKFSNNNFINYNISDIGDILSISYKNPNLYFSTYEKIWTLQPFNATFSNQYSNIITSTVSNYLTQSGINSIYNNNGEFIITGNNSLWKKNSGTNTFTDVYHQQFFNQLKPKFLFLDYDAGSKVYWHDDYGQYRLPSRYAIPVNVVLNPLQPNTFIEFGECTKEIFDSAAGATVTYPETNWITYWKDRMKTFEYYSHLSDNFKVEPSFKFSCSTFFSGDFTYNGSNVSIDYKDIKNLMPDPKLRFREGPVSIITPTPKYSLLFYNFLGIWIIEYDPTNILDSPEVGDVLSIESSSVKGKFIINKILSRNVNQVDIITGQIISRKRILYLYFFTNFNENIINNLKNENVIKIRNLNKYSFEKGRIGIFEIPDPNLIGNSIIIPTGTTIPAKYIRGSYAKAPSYKVVENNLIEGKATFDVEVDLNGNIYSITLNDKGDDYSINDILIVKIYEGGNIVIKVLSIDSSSLLIDNFSKHYISYAYDIETTTHTYIAATPSSPIPIGASYSFQITAKYSRYSAYYNLETNIRVLSEELKILEADILYPTGFLNFGYKPTYNILNYLNFVNPNIFKTNKEYLALPKYDNIPCITSSIPDTAIKNDNIIYTEFTLGKYSNLWETNILCFGVNLKHIWKSFMIHTFVDVIITEGFGYPPTNSHSSKKTERLIIVDKYYDDKSWDTPYYVLVFHDSISSNSNNISSVSIHSRRTLKEISDDLQYINGLQRPKWSEKTIELGYTYTNYETGINFKINTDSYAKALLSDSQTVKNLTGIIYTDYKYELAMQILKLNREFNFNILIQKSVNNKFQLFFPTKHQLITGDNIVIESGLTASNSILMGLHTVKVMTDSSVELNINYITPKPKENFTTNYIKKDPFMNYEPIDIFGMGVQDRKVKQAVQINEENWDIDGNQYFLQNIDYNKYRFILIDGMDLVRLTENYWWILDAEVSEAVIGMDEVGNLIWYRGVWEGGRWFSGTWLSGIWKSGDWYDGIWSSKVVSNNLANIKADDSTNELSSLWYGGRWFGGLWENGTWYSGRWYGGDWLKGRWFDGTWNDGKWFNGRFIGGIWVLGTWYNGVFNRDNSISYWLDGKFLGGDFENGIWYNGEFNQLANSTVKSRFGTKSTNTKNSIWYGGKFFAGEFHSFLDTESGVTSVSRIHKYSNWHSGSFINGTFYGGNVFNIDFRSGLWVGGISNELDVIHIKANNLYNSFSFDGIYRFNIGDEIHIVDNDVKGTYSVFGTLEKPSKYTIVDTYIDEENKITEVTVDVQLSKILSVNTGKTNTGLKCISYFKNSTWNSGIWFNGIFEDGNFNGGIWYQGIFSGTWG